MQRVTLQKQLQLFSTKYNKDKYDNINPILNENFKKLVTLDDLGA